MYREEIKWKYLIVFKNKNIYQSNNFDEINKIAIKRKNNIYCKAQRNVTWGKYYVNNFINIDKIDYKNNAKMRLKWIKLSEELNEINKLIINN